MPRPRLHDAALRVRLLETASAQLSQDGPAGLTVRGVAAAAGTSASAVYALFGSRELLVAAVADEGYHRFAGHLAAVPRTQDAVGDLFALGLAYRESALADPHFYRVMFGLAPGPGPGPSTDLPTFAVLRDAVARLLGAPGAAEDAALVLWGHVHGMVMLELAGLLPGTGEERSARYAGSLRAIGAALLFPAPGPGRP